MKKGLHRSLWLAGLSCWAGLAGALEFERLPPLDAGGMPLGVHDRYGLAVAADGDTVALTFASRPGFFAYGGTVEIWVRQPAGWHRQATIEGFGRFGQALSLQGDRLLIGSPGEPGTPQTGEAEIWQREGDAWTLHGRLSTTGLSAGDAFGHAVALDGDRALVGAPGHDGPEADNQGALHVFAFDGTRWSERARLRDPSARRDDLLGASVAWSGDLALGGAVGLDVQVRAGQGGVHAFAPRGAQWQHVQTVTAPDGQAGDGLGVSMAAGATTVVIGAHMDDVGGQIDAGSARVFRRDGERLAFDALLAAARPWPGLGYAVSLDGDRVALAGGATTPVVFARQAGGWVERAVPDAALGDAVQAVALSGDRLVSGVPAADVGSGVDRGVVVIQDLATPGAPVLLTSGDRPLTQLTFGYDLAIDAGQALIGAPGLCAGFCPPTVQRGSAHFFARAANGGMKPRQVEIGTPSRLGDGYGHAVALRGDRALVAGGGGHDWAERPYANLFERDAEGRWRLATQLVDAQGQPLVAEDVAIDGDLAAVGSHRSGLHVFHRGADGGWRHEAQFPSAGLGALALDGHTLVLGFPAWSGSAEAQGAVYVLERRDGRWALTARLLGESTASLGFGDEVAIDGDHLLVGEHGRHGDVPGGGVNAFERTARGWESRGRLALPTAYRWQAGIAVRGDLAMAFARRGADAAVHAFEFGGGRWSPVGRQPAKGPRIAFDGETLLVSDFALDVDSANEVEVFRIRR